MKLFLFVLLFPLSAFSTDLSGTAWALTGVGCMDSSLSPSSYRSKPSSLMDVSNGKFNFIDDSNLQVEYTREGRRRVQRGTYSVSGDKVDYRGPNGEKGLDMYIREDILVSVAGGHESVDHCCPRSIRRVIEGGVYENWRQWKKAAEARGEDWEEHKKEANLDIDDELTPESVEELFELKQKCAREYPFVFILRRVS